MIGARLTLALLVAGACARPAPPAAQAPLASTSAAFAGWDSVSSTPVAPGVVHIAATTSSGPWAVQALVIDLDRCAPDIAARKGGPPLAERATTSSLSSAALAAINADFFMLPGGTPVGPHVDAGAVLAGPGRRVAFFVTAGGYDTGRGSIEGFAAAGSDSAQIDQVNRPLAGDAQHDSPSALALYTGWYGDTVAAAPDHPAVRMRLLQEGVAVVFSVDTVAMPLDSATLALRSGPATAAWLRRRAPGDTIRWNARLVTDDGEDVAVAVGGFPLLVSAGRDVVAEQSGVSESFGPARHPRTAVGWSADRLLWVVVDGRQEGWSAGMSLVELADLMLRLGATEAINLDGGGSSAMIVRSRVANRPSDPQGERAVGNALVLRGCR